MTKWWKGLWAANNQESLESNQLALGWPWSFTERKREFVIWSLEDQAIKVFLWPIIWGVKKRDSESEDWLWVKLESNSETWVLKSIEWEDDWSFNNWKGNSWKFT